MRKFILILTLSISLLSNATEKDSLTVNNFQKTDEVLSEIVKKALVVAEKTGDFVIEQTPLLLQEFYAWHIWSNVFWIVFAFMVFLIGRYVPYFWLSKDYKDGYYDITYFSRYGDDGASFAYALFIVTSISSLIVILISIHDLIYILVAPKLYLIDYFIK